LDHSKPRGPYPSKVEVDAIDRGDERLLFVDELSSAVVDRRRISVRWFIGTVLTALSGAALMGGAVYAVLDREANFAAIPERVEATLHGTLARPSARPSRARRISSNRLPRFRVRAK
jgi:hypothetical protein